MNGAVSDQPAPVEPADVPDQIADQVRRRFESAYHRRPEAVFSAPGRVNLIGEHTDYNDGLCLPIALPYATYVAMAARDDDVVTFSSLQEDGAFSARLDELGPGQVSGWVAYAAGVVWAAREAGIEVPGMDVLVHGTLPIGAGLSSSASLECAVALAVCAASGLPLDREVRLRLIEICGRAEREVTGAPTGGMDQTISLLARAGHALLLDCRDWSFEHVGWDLAVEGFELIVVDTRTSHALSDGSYGSRRDECAQAARALGVRTLREVATVDALSRLTDPVLLRRARHVTTEIARVGAAVAAIEGRDYAALGDIFSASHRSLRDDFEVSCAELDTVCAAALRAGALGARMTGGGFGGSAIVLARAGTVQEIRRAVSEGFGRASWDPPRFLAASASRGAARLDTD